MSLIFHRLSACLVSVMLVFSLVGCGSSPKDSGISTTNRVPVLDFSDKKPTADTGLRNFTINLPQPTLNKSWAQSGGNAEHTLAHVAMVHSFDEAWLSSIGAGSNGDYRLLAQPVLADGRLFTMDAEGTVSSFTASDGDRLWRVDTTPKDRDSSAMGGGLGFDAGKLYVTTGFGEVLALNASNGSVIWRKLVGKPFRASPTIADGRLYVVTIDNELHVLETKDGTEQWHHSGITESASLMGASNPAVLGDSVVVAYSSGEIYDLRAQNGRVAWNDVLASKAQVGALPAIADIRGLPVIDRGMVYAVSHSGRTVAIDLRTGDRAWEAEVGGVNTPCVVGNIVFVVSNDNELVALARETGRIVWVKDLQKTENTEDRDAKPMHWSGPVLAGTRLWMTNSIGHVTSFAIANGAIESDFDVEEPIYLGPIFADNALYVLTDKGNLIALR